MILIDYSQIGKGILKEFEQELKISSEEKITNIVRHVMLNTIKSYKKRFPQYADKIIIACDSKNYWRKDIFPHYKYKRKESQKSDGVDWDFIYKCMDTLRDEIAAFLPWQVLAVERTEADDIIGTLIKYVTETESSDVGLISEPPKILVISSDKDFKEFYKYPNYRQWSPLTKVYTELEKGDTPQKFLRELIGRGDTGDGIPCIRAEEDHFVNGTKRQPSMYADFVDLIREKGRDACETEFQRNRWDKNESLINIDKLPQNYKDDIIHAYKNTLFNRNKNILLQYFVDKKLVRLIDVIEEFY